MECFDCFGMICLTKCLKRARKQKQKHREKERDRWSIRNQREMLN